MAQQKKPANAKWLAKVKVDVTDPSHDFPLGPGQAHAFPRVELAWYGDDRLKVTLEHGAPGVIRQAYLTGPGRDIIVELSSRP